jgi:hypothetical protein
MWPAGGVLVADTSFSSAEDYGLAVDAGDNVLVAYRESGTPFTIEVQKISPAGALLWNPAGVQVSTAASNGPRACATSDGGMVVGWTESGVAKLQKLDSNGNTLWAVNGVSDTAAVGSLSLSGVVSDNAGGAIALYVNSTGGFSSPRHLRAQRFAAADGAKLWNAGASVAVFDGGSLQVATFPAMIADGAGGFVVAWYDIANARNAWVQRVDVNGVEAFPHNGVSVANDLAGRIRVSAAAALAPSGDVYLIATEANSGQSQWHLIAQRFNSAGARQWGDAGLELNPIAAVQPSFVQAQPTGGGVMALWFESNNVMSAGLTSAGTFAWSPGILPASSDSASKARLSSTLNAAGSRVFMSFSDTRNAGGPNPGERDIFAQNVNLDGSLGLPGDADSSGFVDVDDLIAVILGWGACPAPPTFCTGDVVSPPRGNGVVDVDDLIAVIINWG